MVRVATYFAMTFGAFLFWQSLEKLHVWIALHQDEKSSSSYESYGSYLKLERLEKEREIKRLREELLAEAKERESLA